MRPPSHNTSALLQYVRPLEGGGGRFMKRPYFLLKLTVFS